MTCADYQPLLSAYLDREVSPEDQREVARHLAECSTCTEELHALLALKETLRAHPLPSMPGDLLAEIEAQTLDREESSLRPRLMMRPWIYGIGVSAAALGAWMLWNAQHTARPQPPVEVVQQAPAAIQVHAQLATHAVSRAEDGQACQDQPRGC